MTSILFVPQSKRALPSASPWVDLTAGFRIPAECWSWLEDVMGFGFEYRVVERTTTEREVPKPVSYKPYAIESRTSPTEAWVLYVCQKFATRELAANECTRLRNAACSKTNYHPEFRVVYLTPNLPAQ